MSTISPNLKLNIPASDGSDVIDFNKFFINNFNNIDSLAFNGGQYIKQLTTPTAPTIATSGTTGTTTYSYYVVAIDKAGNKTLPSPVGTVTTGNATLSSTNYNVITWTAVTGAVAYDILKGDTGHSLATNVTGATLNDTGQTTNLYTAPTRNATGDFQVDGTIINAINPYLRLEVNGTPSLANGGPYVVVQSNMNIEHNIGGWTANGTGGTYTVPYTGVYFVSGFAAIQSMPVGADLVVYIHHIYNNGANSEDLIIGDGVSSTTSKWVYGDGSMTIYLNKGDAIGLALANNSSGAVTIEAARFTIALINRVS